jgi:hypothetical protein
VELIHITQAHQVVQVVVLEVIVQVQAEVLAQQIKDLRVVLVELVLAHQVEVVLVLLEVMELRVHLLVQVQEVME